MLKTHFLPVICDHLPISLFTCTWSCMFSAWIRYFSWILWRLMLGKTTGHLRMIEGKKNRSKGTQQLRKKNDWQQWCNLIAFHSYNQCFYIMDIMFYIYLDSLEVNVKIINWSIHSNYVQGLLLDMLIVVLYLILVSIPCCSIDTLQCCALRKMEWSPVIWSCSLKSGVARIWFL